MRLVRVVARYLSVGAVLAVVLLPMYWIVISSFKTVPELTSPTPTFWPQTFTLEHYVRLFEQVPFVTYFLNSVYVALASTAITLVLASLAAYSVYRCQYPGREAFFRAFISIYIFPRVLLLIPLYVVFTRLGIIDTLLALVIVNVTVVAPFSIWMLRAFFTGIPLDLEDAAMVDGATRLQVLARIFLPLSAPGLAALALNSFLMSWTEYLFAVAFIISDRNKTLPVGMAHFLQQYFIDWGLLMSSSVIIAVPPILLFGIAGRWFIKGLTAGAIR